MAEEIAKAAAETSAKTVLDFSLTAGAFSLSLKIDNVWLAGAVSVGALSLGAFYLACKGPSENAIRKALERKFLGVVDRKVKNIEDGHSILIELLCGTETSLLLFLEDLEIRNIKFRLEEEFKKIGFQAELDVTLRNARNVYQQANQIRSCRPLQEAVQQISWKQKYIELAQMVDEVFEKQAADTLLSSIQMTTAVNDESVYRLKLLDRYLSEIAQLNKRSGTNTQGKDLQGELDIVKETLKRETAISKGLRGTVEKLQEENKRLVEIVKHEKVDGMEEKDEMLVGKKEIKYMQKDVLELREKVHELEKENEFLQQKLKKKEKELERFQALETDTDSDIQQPRPRASSGTSLGASSGYQSEEDPDETLLEIIQMPQSQAVQEGKKLVLSCRTRSLPDVSYRWVKDDIEIPGANRSDLVLDPVSMQDFGRYFCRVRDKSGSAASYPAEIDVFPSAHLRFRGIHEIDKDTTEAITYLLSKKRLPGLATWKQVARRFAMRETEISSLEMEQIPARAMLEKLTSLAPNLTVYFLCKTFKEAGLRRLDLVDVLSKKIVIPAH